jgi:hypothetical protein
MKITTQLLILTLCLISHHGFSQTKIQLAVGGTLVEQTPSLLMNFADGDNLQFYRRATKVDVSILSTKSFTNRDVFNFRYGVNFRGTPFTSILRYEKNINGTEENIHLVYDQTNVDINLPLEIVYQPKKWAYTFVGFAPTIRVDLTKKDLYYRGGVSFLSEEEAKNEIEHLSQQVNSFGLNFRAGIGFRYKPIGFELTYDQLLTSAVKSEFTFRIIFHLRHAPETFLVWDID